MNLRNIIPIRQLTKSISAVVTFVVTCGILAFVSHPSTTELHHENNRLKLIVQHQINGVTKNRTNGVLLESIKRVNTQQINNKTKDLNRKLLKLEHAGFWEAVSDLAGGDELYPADLDVDIVLRRMASTKILRVMGFPTGTSFKWVVVLEGGQRAVFKPQLVTPDGDFKEFCNMGHEQPGYEVAAFHLMRLFGWRNVPFVTGRKVDIATEIFPVADDRVRKSIKLFDNGTACLIHKCYYCPIERKFCLMGNKQPGSLMFWLKYPLHYEFGMPKEGIPYHLFHPLSLNQSFHGYGLNDHRHCDFVRSRPLYSDPRYFLDLVDISIMGHVMSHEDEKHIYIEDEHRHPIMTVHIDHGMAFCDRSLVPSAELFLAVIKQCCLVRKKTVEGLSTALPTLKADFASVTSDDQLYPLLTTSLLDEVIARTSDVFKVLKQCKKVVPDSILFDSVH